MASRHKAREYALQILYQAEATGTPAGEVVPQFWREPGVPPDVRRFAERLATGTSDSLTEVDPLLRDHLAHWRLERLGIVDRCVLRLAVFEFLHEPATPRIVVIDEAIELAKRFGGEESGQFVNGILDAVRKKLEAVPSL
ncbi:MAG TPA: transcription antitermination factor NusB [Candidatus Polarisedimenticolia bacterium]|nr:transcription antitermination factor NusB [Candidatus Polarisedimenticolia bacterium]